MHAIESTIRHLHESDDGQQNNKQLPFLKNIEATTSFYQLNGVNSSEFANRSQSMRPLTGNGKSNTPRTVAGILETSTSFYEAVRNVPGNKACADCGNTDAKWASINLGVSLFDLAKNWPFTSRLLFALSALEPIVLLEFTSQKSDP
jgi:hypothetical protein